MPVGGGGIIGGGGGGAAVDPSNAVYVNQQATGGSGTGGSPWTGWDTAITWTANTEYRFPAGYYSYATSPNFCLAGLALIGESGTILKYTGSGVAVNFTAPAGTWVFGMRMENFTIQGTPASSDQGLFLSGVRASLFKNITIQDFVTDGLCAEACVSNTFLNLYVPRKSYVTQQPKNCVKLDARSGDGSQTTACVFVNAVLEGASEKGIYIKNSFWNKFSGGTAEGLDGAGLIIDANSGSVNNDGNQFLNFDFEVNNQATGTVNVEVRGNSQQFLNCNCDGTFRIYPSKRTHVIGGGYVNITIDSGVTSACIKSLELTGTLSDSGFATRKEGIITAASSGLPLVEQIPPYTPTYYNNAPSAGHVATNCQYGNFFYFVATENFTLDNPTGMSNGTEVWWRIQQDNTGSRLITLGSAFNAGSWTVTLTTTATKYDYLFAKYNSASGKWDILDFQKGY